MKKLKLNLDDLQVESFDSTPSTAGPGRGTIFGLATDGNPTCYDAGGTCGIDCDTSPDTCYVNCTYQEGCAGSSLCPTGTYSTCGEPTCVGTGCGGGGDTDDCDTYTCPPPETHVVTTPCCP